MATKFPLYEVEIRRTERLAVKTAKELKISCFQNDVKCVTKCLRTKRSQLTPLALHFIDLAGQELCLKRGSVAKACLLMAKSLCDDSLLHHLSHSIFPQAFSQTEAQDMDVIAKQIANFMKQMASGQAPPVAILKFPLPVHSGGKTKPQKPPKPPGFAMDGVERN